MSYDLAVHELAVTELGLLDLPTQRRPVAARPALHPGKRLSDLVLAATLMIVLLPALFVVAALVGLTSRGGVLYRQTRVGLDGRHFTMIKFRTMHGVGHERLAEVQSLDEGNGVLFKIRRDPRVTSVGRVLRRLSLDELPQLINVLRGDMSLVGPRPALPREVNLYDSLARRRLQAKPGITGLWQVSGRSDLPWDKAIALDLHYVHHASPLMDLKILLRTVTAVTGGRGAY